MSPREEAQIDEAVRTLANLIAGSDFEECVEFLNECVDEWLDAEDED